MKNSLKIAVLALAIDSSFAACKGKGSASADSTKVDSTKIDSTKKDTTVVKVDSTKKDTTVKK
jgi:hypothetical protein